MTKIAERYIAPNHPALAGHFPGCSNLAGVLLMSEALLEAERHFWLSAALACSPVVKFVAPLRPSEPFAINKESEDRDRLVLFLTR